MIYIIGLGLNLDDVTLKAHNILCGASTVVVKTSLIKPYRYFKDNNIYNITLDDIFIKSHDFDELNINICNKILSVYANITDKPNANITNANITDTKNAELTVKENVYTTDKANTNITAKPNANITAKSENDKYLCYAVGGDGVSDKSVGCLIKVLKEGNIPYKIIAGIGYDSAAIAATVGYLNSKYTISATDYVEKQYFNQTYNALLCISEVYDRYIASELKLRLLKGYGESIDVIMYSNTNIEYCKLCDIDKLLSYDYSTTLIIKEQDLLTKEVYNFNDLLEVVYRLRGINGCKWDMAQTHMSIRSNAIEEAYELAEAIELDDIDKQIEEAGDVLLQGVFHAVIADGAGEYDYLEMLTVLCRKLITRHTHIFGNIKADNEKEALLAWENAKGEEKNYKSYYDRMQAIAYTLPGIMESYKLQKIAAKVGFDWDCAEPAIDKVIEELNELKEAASQDKEMESGDLLFAAVNVIRLYGIDPELAIKRSNKKFKERFKYIEDMATSKGRKLSDMTLDEMDKLWTESKAYLK